MRRAEWKERFTPWLLSMAFTATALWVLFKPISRLNATCFVSTLVLFGAAIHLLAHRNDGFHKAVGVMSPGRIIACLSMAALFVLMLSIKELLRYPIFDRRLFQILFIIVLFSATVVSIDATLRFFLKAPDSGPSGDITVMNAIYLVEGFVHLFANYPFRPQSDCMSVYRSIVAGNWRDWHTIGYQIYVSLCMKLGGLFGNYHPFAACFVQTVLWFIIFFRISRILRRCFGKRPEYLWCLANIFMFIPIMYLGVMYKDVIFSMCLLAFCAELLLFIHEKLLHKSNAIGLALSGCGTAMFRHGIVVAVALTLVGLALYYLLKKSGRERTNSVKRAVVVICVLLFIFGAYFGVKGIGKYVLYMKGNPPYVKYTVPFYVCGNLASTHPELFNESDIEILEEYLPFDEWKAAYESDIYWGDTLTRTWGYVGKRVNKVDDAYGFKIVELNARLLLRKPLVYINAITQVTSIVWQIARPADGYEWATRGYYSREVHSDKDPAFVSADYGVQNPLGLIQQSLYDWPITSFIFYRGGIWVFLLALEAVVILLKRIPRYLFVLTTPLIIVCMLMISCPAQDPRFVLPFVETGMLGFVLAKCVGAGSEISHGPD